MFFLDIYKTLIISHIKYCILTRNTVFRQRKLNVILKLEGIQRRVIKIIKNVKDYSYRERLEKLGLIPLLGRKMRGELIKNN